MRGPARPAPAWRTPREARPRSRELWGAGYEETARKRLKDRRGRSEVVVEERLAVARVAVHELATIRRDLREARAETGLGGLAGTAFARPLHDRARAELEITGQEDAQRDGRADRGDLVGGDEDAPVLDNV